MLVLGLTNSSFTGVRGRYTNSLSPVLTARLNLPDARCPIQSVHKTDRSLELELVQAD